MKSQLWFSMFCIAITQCLGRDLSSTPIPPRASLPTEVINHVNNLQNNVSQVYDFVDTVEIENEDDIIKLIQQIQAETDKLYQTERENLEVWRENAILAPYLVPAQQGLKIAHDQLNDIAEKVGERVLESIQQARETMNEKELRDLLRSSRQMIEIEMTQPFQYFLEAADAISHIAEDIGAQQELRTMQSGHIPPINGGGGAANMASVIMNSNPAYTAGEYEKTTMEQISSGTNFDRFNNPMDATGIPILAN